MKLKIRHINKNFSYNLVLIHEALLCILMMPELYILKEKHFILDVEYYRDQPLLPCNPLDQDLVALDELHHPTKSLYQFPKC